MRALVSVPARRLPTLLAALVLAACGNTESPAPNGDRPAAIQRAEQTLRDLETAVALYRVRHKRTPQTLDLLTEAAPEDGEPYVATLTDDPWGTPYRYRRLGPSAFRIASAGPDRTFDTPDDLQRPPVSDR